MSRSRSHSGRSSQQIRSELREPEPDRRERSRDRSFLKPYTELNEEDYSRENRRLYPPDGYYQTPVRRSVGGGKRRRETVENRSHPQEFQDIHADYNRRHDAARHSNTVYQTQRNEYRTAEEISGLTSMFENASLRGTPLFDRSSTGVYGKSSTQALRHAADDREDKAYSYSTRRSEAFDQWPRIMRTSQSDKRHHDATLRAWDEHESAKRDQDDIYRRSRHHRRHT